MNIIVSFFTLCAFVTSPISAAVCADSELDADGLPTAACLTRLLANMDSRLEALGSGIEQCADCSCSNDVNVGPASYSTVKDTCTGQTFNGSCYELETEARTWLQASEYCKTQGGHLADITSEEENDVIKSLMDGQHVWLDATDVLHDGVWRWMTSRQTIEEAGFSDWGPNQPNGSDQDDEDCMNLRATTNQWNDSTCTDKESFICEYLYSSGE